MPVTGKIDAAEFLREAESFPVIDVRSPSEYRSGHIPSAINIPLFDDKERETVGIAYKNEGREAAILKGLGLAGPSIARKLKEALDHAVNKNLLVHCWRGGMRSESMAWMFSLGGINTRVLDGGYKSYRNYILEKLSKPGKMIILGGFTGSSKTHILRCIKGKGPQVIDLEQLANHKGSAFGSLGQPPQPTTEHFANILFEQWNKLSNDLPVWLEDESRNIGTVFMPILLPQYAGKPGSNTDDGFKNKNAETAWGILGLSSGVLIASIEKISRRLGGDNTHDAVSAVERGDFAKAIEITLNYYDKAYLYGINKKNRDKISYIKTDTDDIEINASMVIEAANKITW